MPITRRPGTPGASRSGGAARRRAGAAAGSAARRVRGMSRRTIAMIALLVLVGTVLFPIVRATIQQNARIDTLRKDIAAREQRVDELQVQSARWQDPAYVRAQARERFNYVMPGEVGYVVLDTSQTEQGEKDPSSAAAREAEATTGTWFGTLWESTQQAGHAPADPLGTGSSR